MTLGEYIKNNRVSKEFYRGFLVKQVLKMEKHISSYGDTDEDKVVNVLLNDYQTVIDIMSKLYELDKEEE